MIYGGNKIRRKEKGEAACGRNESNYEFQTRGKKKKKKERTPLFIVQFFLYIDVVNTRPTRIFQFRQLSPSIRINESVVQT